jgi:hypothetical protein
MSELIETVTDESTRSLAKDLGLALTRSAAETAVGLVGAVLVLAAAGKTVELVQKRKAKKSKLAAVPAE